jgi:hypothetical protein
MKNMLFGTWLMAAVAGCGMAELDEGSDVSETEAAVSVNQGALVAIQSLYSNKCMDVAGGKNAIGAVIVHHDCHFFANQQFRVAKTSSGIVFRWITNPDLCIGLVRTAYPKNHDQLQLVNCTGDAAQYPNATWEYQDTLVENTFLRSAFRPVGTGDAFCADIVPNWVNINGTPVQVYECHVWNQKVINNQHWRIRNL